MAIKRLVIDLDDTITMADTRDYAAVKPRRKVIEQIKSYKEMGFEVVIHTSRNMRTYEGNVGKIVVNTTPTIIEWLTSHDVPFDEIWVGKPWCGDQGFYVDDKSIRPDEFEKLSYSEIAELLSLKVDS